MLNLSNAHKTENIVVSAEDWVESLTTFNSYKWIVDNRDVTTLFWCCPASSLTDNNSKPTENIKIEEILAIKIFLKHDKNIWRRS